MVGSHDHTVWSHGRLLNRKCPVTSKTVEICTHKSHVHAWGFPGSDLLCMLHEIAYVQVRFLLQIIHPVRIRVRIDPPHPLVCRKRRLNGAVLRIRPEKPRHHVTAGVAR
jgi:hypothetical protein